MLENGSVVTEIHSHRHRASCLCDSEFQLPPEYPRHTTLFDFSYFKIWNITTKQSLPTLCHLMYRPFCVHKQTKKWRKKSLMWHERSAE